MLVRMHGFSLLIVTSHPQQCTDKGSQDSPIFLKRCQTFQKFLFRVVSLPSRQRTGSHTLEYLLHVTYYNQLATSTRDPVLSRVIGTCILVSSMTCPKQYFPKDNFYRVCFIENVFNRIHNDHALLFVHQDTSPPRREPLEA
jgi:hypothetical protein